MSQKRSKFVLGVSLVFVVAILVSGLPYSSLSWISMRNTVGAQYEPAGEPAEGVECSIAADSVVGKLVSDSLVYWDSNYNATSGTILKAGTTSWVLGPNETGDFYLLCYAGVYLWVPADVLDTNPDEVWQDQPLPIIIVELVNWVVNFLTSLLA